MKTKTRCILGGIAVWFMSVVPLMAQEPVDWGTGPEVQFHTFSIVAVDPKTGETGTIVTSRVTCVGHIVPWDAPVSVLSRRRVAPGWNTETNYSTCWPRECRLRRRWTVR